MNKPVSFAVPFCLLTFVSVSLLHILVPLLSSLCETAVRLECFDDKLYYNKLLSDWNAVMMSYITMYGERKEM